MVRAGAGPGRPGIRPAVALAGRTAGAVVRRAATLAGAVAGAMALPAPALADHLSGGTPDVMGAFGGISLVLTFLGLLGVLGLWPGRLRGYGQRLGLGALVAGLVALVAGSWYTAHLGGPEEFLGGAAWGQVVMQQFAGLFLVFGGFSAAVIAWALRHGVLSFGEAVKYGILHRGDPVDPAALRPPRRRAEGLVWVPVAGMVLLALFIAGGLAYVTFTLGTP
ncbi:MAG: hypothetical protein DIU70_001370 [Bacillota bacterium]